MPTQMFCGNDEPSVEELLDDKISRLLRARDGVRVIDVVRVMDEAKAAIARRDEREASLVK